MDEDQTNLLMKWVEAVIDEKIEQAFGRDAGREWLTRFDLEQEIKNTFKSSFA